MAISQWQHVQKKHIEKNTLLLLAVDFSLKKTHRAPKHRAPLFLMVSLLTTKLAGSPNFCDPLRVWWNSPQGVRRSQRSRSWREQGLSWVDLDLRLFGCWKKWPTKNIPIPNGGKFHGDLSETISEKRRGNFTQPDLDFHEIAGDFPKPKSYQPWEPRSVRSIIWPNPIYKQPKSPVIWNFSAFFGRTFPFGILACSWTENGFMEPFKTMRLMSVTGHPNHSLTIWLDVYGFGWRLWFGEAWVTGLKDHPVVSISGGSLARGHCWWVPLRIRLFSSPFFQWP